MLTTKHTQYDTSRFAIESEQSGHAHDSDNVIHEVIPKGFVPGGIANNGSWQLVLKSKRSNKFSHARTSPLRGGPSSPTSPDGFRALSTVGDTVHNCEDSHAIERHCHDNITNPQHKFSDTSTSNQQEHYQHRGMSAQLGSILKVSENSSAHP